MYALNGRITGNAIVVDENISSYNGYKVIITILDKDSHSVSEKREIEGKQKAARDLAGLWSSHDNLTSVDETVRTMRRGRETSRKWKQ